MDISDYNPPLPPEFLADNNEIVADKIGETVFSKYWIFQSLVSVMQAVEKENTSENDVLELDSELEEKICMLWDMSSNKDIAYFLLENKTIEMFLEIINLTVSPRLIEIIVGILGNMASFGDICEYITKNDKLIEQIIRLVGSTDPPILVQTIRLIHVCVMNDISSSEWIKSLKKNKDFIQYLTFILKSSLNGELLKGTLKLVYCILDKDEILCEEWNMQEMFGVVIESGKQLLNLNDYKALDEFWHTLYFLLQQENIHINLAEESFTPIYEIFRNYILKHKENENLLPQPDSYTAVAAAVSIFIILYNSRSDDEKHSLNTDHCLRYIKKMFEIIKKIIDKKETLKENSSVDKKVTSEAALNDDSMDVNEDLDHLYILCDSLKDLCNLMNSSA